MVRNGRCFVGVFGQQAAARGQYLGGVPIPGSPADFGKLVKSETDKWEKVVRAANLAIE